MPIQQTKGAILVLESPWGLDERDANRSSVKPFIEGMAKYAGDIEVCHTVFYDEDSFEDGLEKLCKTPFRNTLVYVAAHGSQTHAGAHLTDISSAVRKRSKDFNITGMLLGSCYAGSITDAHKLTLQGSNLRWIIGYASACEWLTGTMIDCALLNEAVRFHQNSYGQDNLVRRFSQALAPFSAGAAIGGNVEGHPTALRDSLQFVVQSPGNGNRPAVISEEVFAAHAKLRI
ncbi:MULTISPECIES: hypothetical protein [Massilia]|uniref:CHAT domain-containing protein n=1 Tax=Massilia aurea TaxID=373040 RepID=A0A422QLB2_9BURK|nr:MULTISPECIES: hypothetical protein [Massilia]MDY0963752.1 hypothetical protein [Massilia sp. CFBP9026]RNF30611.1 hypothetical protein NM04_11670 [Massilia aurea]